MLRTRELIAIAGSLLYVISFGHTAAVPGPRNSEEKGLNDAAKARGKLYFGTATEPSKFLSDAAYYKQLNNTHDFGQLVPESSMKWDKTEPERNVFNFTEGDRITALATANGQITRCHALIWHMSTPDWVIDGGFDNATLISIIENHITQVVEHYKGICYAWDVVNEGQYQPLKLPRMWLTSPCTHSRRRKRHMAPKRLLRHHRPSLHPHRLRRRGEGRPGRQALLQRLRHRAAEPQVLGDGGHRRPGPRPRRQDRWRGPAGALRPQRDASRGALRAGQHAEL